jgi:hypothetical protein
MPHSSSFTANREHRVLCSTKCLCVVPCCASLFMRTGTVLIMKLMGHAACTGRLICMGL